MLGSAPELANGKGKWGFDPAARLLRVRVEVGVRIGHDAWRDRCVVLERASGSVHKLAGRLCPPYQGGPVFLLMISKLRAQTELLPLRRDRAKEHTHTFTHP